MVSVYMILALAPFSSPQFIEIPLVQAVSSSVSSRFLMFNSETRSMV